MKYNGEKVLVKLYEDIEDYWPLHLRLLSTLDKNTCKQITPDLLKMVRKSQFIATLNKDQNFLDAKERMIQKGLTLYDFFESKNIRDYLLSLEHVFFVSLYSSTCRVSDGQIKDNLIANRNKNDTLKKYLKKSLALADDQVIIENLLNSEKFLEKKETELSKTGYRDTKNFYKTFITDDFIEVFVRFFKSPRYKLHNNFIQQITSLFINVIFKSDPHSSYLNKRISIIKNKII
jgi:hypothetical protein